MINVAMDVIEQLTADDTYTARSVKATTEYSDLRADYAGPDKDIWDGEHVVESTCSRHFPGPLNQF